MLYWRLRLVLLMRSHRGLATFSTRCELDLDNAKLLEHNEGSVALGTQFQAVIASVMIIIILFIRHFG